MQGHFVIIGAGEAGGRAAAHLRRLGFSGPLTLVGAERDLPYERPVLSKALLTADDFKLPLHAPAHFYAEREIELIHVAASSLNIDAKEVQLADGRVLAYSRLLLCTGAAPRMLDTPGAALAGVVSLREADQAWDLRDRLRRGGHVVIVGGGLIGLEVAASARALGCHVTVVELGPRLMARAVPETVSRTFADVHREHGVDLRFEAHPMAFEGNERLERVALSDGTRIAADLALVAIGVVPRDDLARDAGLAVDDGILVDACCRTSEPDIFAAGDCIRQGNPWAGKAIRLECWQSALDQACVAAEAMLDGLPDEQPPPWMWSDQYEHNLQVVGVPALDAPFIVRGNIADRSYALFQIEDGRVRAAIGVDRGSDMAAARKLVAARSAVDAADLADQSVRLKTLVR